MRKKIRAFLACWGDKHFDWLERGALPSLAQPLNKAALDNYCTFVVLTKPEHKDRAEFALSKSGIAIKDTEFMLLPAEELEKNPHAAGHFMKQAFIMEMGRCLAFNSQILIVPPDTIWGDGSVPHLVELGKQRDSVIFAAHVRVLPEIIDDIKAAREGNRFGPGPITNAKLVSLAFKRLHKTWEEAEDGRKEINSYVGGVLWRYLSENLYAVTHRLPTPYLINPTPEDVAFFNQQLHFGVIDHAWPHGCLIETERQRLIGSSDGAFMVEITDPGANIPPVAPYHADEPDLFWRNLSHNKINRMNTIIFRGE